MVMVVFDIHITGYYPTRIKKEPLYYLLNQGESGDNDDDDDDK